MKLRTIISGLILSTALASLTSVGHAQHSMIVGADLSVLPSTEKAGGKFSQNNQPEDVLKLLRRNGFNAVRLRLFHTPDKKRELVNDLDYVLPLAKRVKAAGFKLLLDFHYSDTWADPKHQSKPDAWNRLSFEELKLAISEYTQATVSRLKAAGATPDWIQLGNEINSGMLWPDGKAEHKPEEWARLAGLLMSARVGAQTALGPNSSTRFIHHIADPHHVIWHLDHLAKHADLPDIIGISYYPMWHGDLASLRTNLDAIAAKYDRPIVIVEVAYPWTNEYFDNHRNVLGGQPTVRMPAYNKTGQAEFFSRFISELKATPGNKGAGFFLWEPAWLPSGEFGSPMENATLFDEHGNALPALDAIREGVQAP